MKIILPKKFSEKQISTFINEFYKNIKAFPNDTYYFDFSESEWISNQSLLLLSGLIKYLYKTGRKFKINLFSINPESITRRQAKQIYQIWEVWKLHKIFDDTHFENYVENFQNSTIPYLVYKYEISTTSYEIFDRIGITPFISLNFIKDYVDEDIVNFQIEPIFKLNKAINNELSLSECEHPFIENTLSTIISKELYENFLDHFGSSVFNSHHNWAYMSISLKRKEKQREDSRQKRFKCNFETEELEEAKSFFCKNNTYKNESIIQFSFLDFGNGIPTTLKEQYLIENKILQETLFDTVDDNLILKYAFKHNTSRHPILDKHNEIEKYIPRGLFDLLIIIKRYKGLIIVRSNFGKILYDFSNTDSIEEAYSVFGKDNEYFPGTFISIYLPAFSKNKKYNKTVIRPELKPDFHLFKKGSKKAKNINLFSIQSKIENNKKDRNKNLIKSLQEMLHKHENIIHLNYISFFGVEDESIIRKSIFYLLTDYEVNEYNSIIIVYPPSKNIIREINNEILELNSVIINYKIHPIPLIYLNIESKEIELDWIGIYDEADKQRLNAILAGEDNYSLALSDFRDENIVLGNVNYSDKYGNFSSKIPSSKTLLTYYERYDANLISEAITKNNCLKKDGLYLCNSNYYQKEFLQISDLLNAKIDREVITRYLFDKIKVTIIDFSDDIKYIAITSSSHKILDSLVNQKKIQKKDCIYFDNYVDFEIDSKVNEINENFRYILICDTISTGSITKRVDEILKNRKAKLIAIGVLVNTLDETYENCREFLKEFEKRLIFLYKYPIKKEKREDLINIDYSPIRINPFTNIPITLSEDLTIKKSILLSNIDFLNCIDSSDISIKFKIFNNIIHPYFFEFKSILENENTKVHKGNTNSLIYKIFTKLENEYNFNFAENNYSIFYPKNSDIQYLDIELLKNNIFYNESIEYFQLERFSTDSGWKFPHTTEYFKEKIIEKPNVMILDDGSCSGDSLLQMINELSYFEPHKIDLLCIIGRIDDHKREFFSKISKFKSSSNKEIDINIYFGTHWHIPTFYQDNNPYSHEIGWVKKLKELQNTPSRIKNYAITIKEEIEPLANKSNEYKYFPIDNETNNIPKKEILFVRNEIGKIIGYRYYKESFIWFNNLIKNTQNNGGYFEKKYNKDIEELIMCFLYEPYLYEKVILTIPDVKDIIESFIKKIIFSNTKDENQAILYYNWDKNRTDFVHLFFIVFNDKKLMYYFDLDKFRKLIDFIGEKKINYILYKLLYYSEFNVNQDGVIFDEIKIIIDTYLQDGNSNKSVKLFRYYISSLPYKDNFDDRLSYIFNQYRLINDARHHKEAITIKIENVLSYLDILSIQYDLELYNNLKENINPILDLIQQILSFSSAYPSYFSKYINLFETDNDSLRLLHKDLSRGISFMTKNSDFQHLISTIKKLRDNFFGINSVPYKIFFNNSTENFIDILTEFVDNNSSNNDFVLEGESINISIYFPKLILKEIIFDEIFTNINTYADKTERVKIGVRSVIDNNASFISIEISNKINSNNANNGGALGTHFIEQLNEYPNNMFSYEGKPEGNKYIQKLRFKKV